MYVALWPAIFGHLVDLREAGLVADDAVAADAHGHLLASVFDVARDRLGLGRDRHASDSKGKHRGQQLVHFARTISWRSVFKSTFDYMRGLSPARCARPLAMRNADRTSVPLHPSCSTPSMKFKGSDNYVATQDLMLAVNAAITLKRPLLVKGEPGTGKTMLAEEVAAGARTAAAAVAHQVDHQGAAGPVRIRRREPAARLAARTRRRRACKDIHNYIVKGVLWQAFTADAAGRAADRRDRQGRHRVPERPAARNRPHGVLLLRDARADPRQASAAWSSSPRTTRRNCPTRSCAAASSTTSSSPTPTP